MFVPRRFLLLHAVLVALPWLVLIGLDRARHDPPAARESARANQELEGGEPVTRGRVGPWGRLDQSPIIISPPLEYIPQDAEAPRSSQWFFPRTAPEQLRGLFSEAGLSDGAAAQLMASSRPEPRIAGMVVLPDAGLVRGLSPAARARIYSRLAESELNPWQQNAFRFYAASVDEWLAGAPLTRQTLDRVRPLVYQSQGFSLFADFQLVRPEITDAQELRRLTKALFRESTFVVRLRLQRGTNLDGVAEYWGRGGRMTDIRPLLESLVDNEGTGAIDITHLLPSFPRQYLYRYPMITLADVAGGKFPNCFWTAMNFFSRQPDDRFKDVENVLPALKRDYFEVHDNYRLGDIAVFHDEAGNLYHAAVYLADGLVFGKNGKSALAPWTIVPVERIRGYYPQHAGGRVTYFRRKDL